MSKIGYGCTKEHVNNIVRDILEKESQPNPFTNGIPCRKWWALFMKCHPTISLCTPEHLPLSRVHSCIPGPLDKCIEVLTSSSKFMG